MSGYGSCCTTKCSQQTPISLSLAFQTSSSHKLDCQQPVLVLLCSKPTSNFAVITTSKQAVGTMPCLAAGEERQQMAGRCLGELVRKMGDRVLQQIIPILVKGMQDPEPSTRQGVCTGLKEVLDNISREQLQEYLGQLLPTVQAALCDEDTTVRQVQKSLCCMGEQSEVFQKLEYSCTLSLHMGTAHSSYPTWF